jgi:hypothetical protein
MVRTGLAHESMATGQHQQAVTPGFAWLDGLQGRTDRGHVRSGNQGILAADHTQQTPSDRRHLRQAGRPPTRTPADHPGAVEITGGPELRQGRGQQGGMAAETESDATEARGRATFGGTGKRNQLARQPVSAPTDVLQQLGCRGAFLVGAPLLECRRVIAQGKVRSGAGEQRHGQGGVAVACESVGHTAHPAIHPEHFGEHHNPRHRNSPRRPGPPAPQRRLGGVCRRQNEPVRNDGLLWQIGAAGHEPSPNLWPFSRRHGRSGPGCRQPAQPGTRSYANKGIVTGAKAP